MQKFIYVPFDNSEHSARALEIGMELARGREATLVGCHVYAAKLHDQRFKSMESGLPEDFRKEPELERQRVIHDSLITSGLELITDSYLQVMSARCAEAEVAFRGVSLEGRNWQALVEDIHAQQYDLVVMGAFGLGRTEQSLIGTVCERVVRRVNRDVLVVREVGQVAADAPVVVCLDGSNRAWGALEFAMDLAQESGRPLSAISAFDPFFHYTLFDSLKTVLTKEASEVFKFEQQEQLHEQIIDSGLAKIYQSHLDIAEALARKRGIAITTRLLEGKASEKILEYASETKPWMLLLGRTGIHGGEEMDLGGVTEHLLRLAPCNLLISAEQVQPPVQDIANATMAWTDEGRTRLNQAPAHARGVAMAAIQRFAVAEGYTMITSSVVDQALEQILPPAARAAMGIGLSKPQSQEAPRDYLSLAYGCPHCSYVHPGKRPSVCPICNASGSLFRVITGDSPASTEELRPIETFDGVFLAWARDALDMLDAIPDYFLRKRSRHKIEKRARSQNLDVISGEFAAAVLKGGSGDNETPATQNNAAQDDDTPRAATLLAENWTDAGWRRLLRAPEGFMRDQARAAIESYAGSVGAQSITLEIAEAGMAQARENMIQATATD